jgi:hypothetical protein
MAGLIPKCMLNPRSKVIAVDIDEVLCPLLSTMMRWRGVESIQKRYPYAYSEILGIPEADARKMVHEFYGTREFAEIQPLARAQDGVFHLKQRGHILYAVTGRQSVVRRETEDWLNRHFTWGFDDLIMTDSHTPFEIPKADVCRALNIGMIIDDDLSTCLACRWNGMRAIHFIGDPVYPWCEESDISCKTWDDIRESPLV